MTTIKVKTYEEAVKEAVKLVKDNRWADVNIYATSDHPNLSSYLYITPGFVNHYECKGTKTRKINSWKLGEFLMEYSL